MPRTPHDLDNMFSVDNLLPCSMLLETRGILAYTTQRLTLYVLPISIATYGSLYNHLLETVRE